jgi:hypothetical protein
MRRAIDEGDLQIKISLRLTASTALALIMGTPCFGQHYTRINLVSSTAGVARITDPQLINPWGLSRTSSGARWVASTVVEMSYKRECQDKKPPRRLGADTFLSRLQPNCLNVHTRCVSVGLSPQPRDVSYLHPVVPYRCRNDAIRFSETNKLDGYPLT